MFSSRYSTKCSAEAKGSRLCISQNSFVNKILWFYILLVADVRPLIGVEPRQYQLRAYVYQARDLLAGDSTGLSGAFLLNCPKHLK